MAGSWGAVVGNLRFFADRFGVPRAGIEGTTIPYDLVRQYAQRDAPRVEVTGPRKHQHLVLTRRLTYFGFELEQVKEPLEGEAHQDLLSALRAGLTEALLAGTTVHPDQGRIRRALEELGELWRRSGGSLASVEPAALRAAVEHQLAAVTSWRGFLETRIQLEPDRLVPAETRANLLALPDVLHLHGDAVPLDYEVDQGGPAVRLRLKEGQARQLQPRDLPLLDRPIRFTVVRGKQPAIRADSLEALREGLRNAPRREQRESRFRPPPRRRR
jgi:hypothetical protein